MSTNTSPRRTIAAALALATIAAAMLMGTTSAHASSERFEVAWSHIGIYPRSTPEMLESNRVGGALPDGSWVEVACETRGATVTSDAGTSNVWEKLTDGTYIPNVFVKTGHDGFTPGLPRCSAPAPPAKAELRNAITADHFLPNQDVPNSLLNYYFSAAGGTVEVDFAFYSSDARLMTWAKQLKIDGIGKQYLATAEDGDVYWASGAFSVARTSEHCWAVKDNYDFNPDKPTNIPFIGNWGMQFFGNAKEFTVRSSGCLFD